MLIAVIILYLILFMFYIPIALYIVSKEKWCKDYVDAIYRFVNNLIEWWNK